MANRRPVILDTDIGGDIDDVWALATLLALEELDVKLITTCFGETDYRTKIVCKFLEIFGATDIPVAIGRSTEDLCAPSQQRWVEGYDLNSYDGTLLDNAASAIVDTIMNAQEEVTIISIGPATNLADVLKIEPRVTEKSRIVGMYGSIHMGYLGSFTACREANVYVDVKALQQVMASDWWFEMVPLDCCGQFILSGSDYIKIKQSESVLAKLVMENYRIWQEDYDGGAHKFDIEKQSSVLFDIPPVIYALDSTLFSTVEMKIIVTDDGMTIEDENGRLISCVMAIDDMDAVKNSVANLLGQHKLKALALQSK